MVYKNNDNFTKLTNKGRIEALYELEVFIKNVRDYISVNNVKNRKQQ